MKKGKNGRKCSPISPLFSLGGPLRAKVVVLPGLSLDVYLVI